MSLTGQQIVGSNLLFESSISRFETHLEAQAATERGSEEVLFIDLTTGTWSGGYGHVFDHHSVRWTGSLTGTYFFADHSVKAGFQYEDNLLNEDWRWLGAAPGGGSWIVKNAEEGPTAYMVGILDFRTEVHNRIASLFAQGSFRLHRRLRFNPGIRWDGQFFKGSTSGLEGSISDQFQPRLGLIFYPGPPEREKITASYARVYEQVPNQAVANWYGGLQQDFLYFAQNPLEDSTGAFPWSFDVGASEPLEGQHYDRYTLGYERVLGEAVHLGIRGVYSDLRQILTASPVSDPPYRAANPGEGVLDFLPRPEARYLGLELSLAKLGESNPQYAASYVLSRNEGNYVGLYDTDSGVGNPNGGNNFQTPTELEDAKGLLPNDRTHVLKLFGAYRFPFGLDVGAFFSFQSGTPLNEFGANQTHPWEFVFLRPRGSAGRTPSIWNLDLHLSYNLPGMDRLPGRYRLILDAFHLFSREEPVRIVQQRFLAVDEEGNQISPNPNYLKGLAFQPPTTVRLGLQVDF
jgi:hypothetical protein